MWASKEPETYGGERKVSLINGAGKTGKNKTRLLFDNIHKNLPKMD